MINKQLLSKSKEVNPNMSQKEQLMQWEKGCFNLITTYLKDKPIYLLLA